MIKHLLSGGSLVQAAFPRAWQLLLLVLLLSPGGAWAQSVANYATARNTGITYTSIASTGNSYTGWRNTTSTDDNLSGATPIGFTFVYDGTPYTQFSVSTNGFLTFNTGTSAIGNFTGAYGYQNNTTFSTAGSTVTTLAALYDDLTVPSLTTALKYLTTGTAGSRVLTAEWIGAQRSTSGSLNFQIRLYEADGHIEFNYGTVTQGTGTYTYSLGINSPTGGATAANLLTLQTANGTTFSSAASDVLATVPATNSQYTFTPPAVLAPTSLTFSNVVPNALTLSFADGSTNEYGFLIYRSTDNVSFTYLGAVASTTTAGTGTAYSYNDTGLSNTTTYYYRVAAYSEGAPSPFLTGSQATPAPVPLCGTYAVGPTGAYASLAAAFLAIGGNGLSCAVVFELQSTYVSTAETFPLAYTFTGGSATNTVTVRPQTGATGLSITSASTTTLSINAGRYLILDGRPGGLGTTSALTVANTATAGIAIQLTNDATNNTVQYCTVQGVNTSTTGGVIVFTATATATGNSNNTVANNTIGDGATTPNNLIYSAGLSTAVSNTGNSITANNLFNFFSAGSASNGILLSGTGNSAWSITNNNIYQTVATRTYTSGNTHSGITIGTGVNYTITGNLIGGQGTTIGPGTGTYAMTGTISTRFVGIQGTFTAAGTVSNIQGNTVRRIALTTASTSATTFGVLGGIYVASGNANIGTATGNTIGEPAVTGSLTATVTAAGGYVIGISTASSNTVTISNNVVAGLQAVGTSGVIAANVTGINATAGTNIISNNTVGSTTVANSIYASAAATTQQLVRGIWHSGSTSAVITGNTVANLSNAGTPASVTVVTQTIGINTNGGINQIGGSGATDGNTVRDLSSAAFATGTFGSATVVGIAAISNAITTTGQQVIQNRVFNLSNTATTGAGINVVGIFYNGPTAAAANGPNLVARNFVHSLTLASTTINATTPSAVVGIAIGAATAASADVQNNFVRLGFDGTGAAITREYEMTGLLKAGTTANNIYFNSLYIGGTGVGSTANNTYAFRRTSTGATDVLRNNIFDNVRTNAAAGGKHYTVLLNNSTTFTSSNNLFYSATNSASTNFLAGAGTSDYTTLADYGTATGDVNSKNGDPQFINPTGSAGTVDLHISPTAQTLVEGNGLAVASVTDDYDGEVRANLTPTDIGADAGNFTPIQGVDAQLLSIDSPAVPFAAGTQPILVTIRNTGTATITSAIIELIVNGASQGPTTYIGSLAAGATAQVALQSFNFVGGTNYTITANITNVNSGATETDLTNNTRTIVTQPALCGSFSVGAGSAYATLDAAVAALNSYGANCAVAFVLTDATYAATTGITITAYPGNSSTNTLTIKPAPGVSPTITGSVAGPLVVLNGVQYVTLDGSNAGTTSQNWTLTNTSTSASAQLVQLTTSTSTSGTAPTFNTVKNMVLTGAASTTTFTTVYGIRLANSAPATTGASNNTFTNNNITKVQTGISVVGLSTAVRDANTVISNNQIGSTTTAAGFGGSTAVGISVSNQNTLTVTGNVVRNPVIVGPGLNAIGNGTPLITTATLIGIDLSSNIGTATVSNNTVRDLATSGGSLATSPLAGIRLGSAVTSATVNANLVTNIKVTATNGYGGYGIYVNTGTANAAAVISNNMVSDINGANYSAFANSSSAGIYLNSTQSGISVVFNSVNMYGTSTYSSAVNTAALAVESGSTALTVRNNVLANANVGSTAGSLPYSLYSLAPAAAYTAINNNDYYSSGAQAINASSVATNVVVYLGSARYTLADVRTATGQDGASISADPQFTASNDLHTSAAALNAAATPVAGVTADFDNDPRDASTPDIGADEFAPATLDIRPAALVSPAANQVCYSSAEAVTVQIQNTATSQVDFSVNNATVTVVVTPPSGSANNQTFTTTLTSGTLAAGASQNVTLPGTLNMSAAGAYTFAVTATVAGDANPGNDVLASQTRTNTAPQSTLPYTETFATSATPTNFTLVNFATSTSANNGTAGSYGLRYNIYSSNTTASATTPVLGVTVSATNTLTFDARFTNFSTSGPATVLQAGDQLAVQIAVCGGAFSTVYTINNTNQNGTGAASTSFYTYSVPLTGVGAGQKVQVRFVATYGGTSGSDFYVDLDNLNVISISADDAGVVAITQPTAPFTALVQPVAVQVKNYGTATLNSVTVNWTVNGVAQTPQTFTGLNVASGATSGNLALGTFNFSTGGPTFTIVATTSAPNGGTDGNTVNDSFTRVVAPALNGLYTVGAGQQFTTLTSATNTLNAAGVSGPVTFSLTDASYTTAETFPIVINSVIGGSSTNTVTIKPAAGVTASILGSSATAILKLNGADYVTIDGANTTGGTTRNLSLTNTNTGTNALVVWLASLSATDGATFNVVKNLSVTGGSNTSTNLQVGIGLLGTSTSLLGQNNDNNTIQNNAISKVAIGIDAEGTSTEAYDNLVVLDNVVGLATSTAASNVTVAGVFLVQTPAAQVTHNTVQNITSSFAGLLSGIELGTGTAGSLVNRNTVRGTYNTTTSGYGVRGISLDPGTGPANMTVRNNAVSGTLGDGDNPTTSLNYIIAGIGVVSGTGYNVFNNSVQMSGDRPNNSYTNKISAAVFVATAVTGVDLRNNVLSNIQTTSDPDAAGTGTNYAVYAQAATGTPFTTIDYNLYDVRSGAAARVTAVSPQFLGRLGGTDYATLATWRTATTQDASSMMTSGTNTPGFTSATDLTPNPANASSYSVNGTGVQIGSVVQDLNGTPRSTTVATGAPDLGAYEVTPTATPNPLEVIGTYALGSTQTFSFNGRTVASITYGTVGTLPTTLTARYYPGTNPPAPFTAGAKYANVYFSFLDSGDGTGFTYTPTLYYDQALLGTIATEGAQRVSQQTPTGYGTYFSTVVNTTNRTLLSVSLDRFGLLAISDAVAPLPVSLTRFEAERQGLNTALTWNTASEKNSHGFEVQVSTDGTAFRTLDFVASPSANSSASRTYAYLDRESGKAGLRYYRLRQLDLDGTATLSPVRTVRFDGKEAGLHLTAMPNPFRDQLTLTIELPAAASAELSLTDATGRTVLAQSLRTPTAGAMQVELPGLAKLASGVYFLQLVVPGQPAQHLKVVKE